MYYPNYLPDTNTRGMVDTWRGYNHNYRIAAGEFYDMENLSSDYYPLLTPRKKRAKLIEDTNIRGILLTENKLCYLAGKKLHFGAKIYDLTTYIGDETGHETDEQQLIRFGAYILIFPLRVYVNLTDDEDIGSMYSSYSAPTNTEITYQMCDIDGEPFDNITASDEAPSDPDDGDYWLNTTTGAAGLNIYQESSSMWMPVATTYISITIPGAELTDYFKEGDTVTFTSGGLPDINAGATIEKLTDTTIVITGIIPTDVEYSETTSAEWTMKIDRKLPDLDYVCACGNRVWGCHFGRDYFGHVTNEIYASALGDFRNWYTYSGSTQDSYAVSVGEDGNWTGCIAYQGKPVFFKENHIYRIYGSYPAEYQLVTNSMRGVQYGSSKSLVVLNEYLIYKSPADIVIYDGSSPTSISQALGREKIYYEACAGATLNKYYIAMKDSVGRHYYFVWDMENGLWMREDAHPAFTQFSTAQTGQIYATNGSEIYGLGSNDNMLFVHTIPCEERVEWYAETGDIGFEFPDRKKVKRIDIRAYLPFQSEIEVWISYDDKPFESKVTITGNSEIRTKHISIQPMRCDHYRLKFTGHGDCRIYTMTTVLETDGGRYG